MKEFIDASVFLGMHSKDEKIRVACKNYFVKKLNNKVRMNLEQVGKCDDLIWNSLTFKEQAKYYPFMDYIHTIMDIKRISYSQNDFITASKNGNLKGLPFTDRLTICQTISNKGILYTINNKLLNKSKLPIKEPKYSRELKFPEKLEKLYQNSLAVRV